jgi:hypothetical protein
MLDVKISIRKISVEVSGIRKTFPQDRRKKSELFQIVLWDWLLMVHRWIKRKLETPLVVYRTASPTRLPWVSANDEPMGGRAAVAYLQFCRHSWVLLGTVRR